MSLTYVIADVHGRYDLLIQALNQIFARQPGTVITLGDYIDRGPESRYVIDHLMSLQKSCQPGWKVICLKGNHEDMMLETIRGPNDPRWWIRNGGGATLRSYGHAERGPFDPSCVPEAHLDWLQALPLMHLDKHRVYVHAGVEADQPLDQQDSHSQLWMLYENGDHGGHGERYVVHGHHQHEDGPLLMRGRCDLDTLAWKTGRLVVGVFDDDVAGEMVEMLEIQGEPDPRYKEREIA